MDEYLPCRQCFDNILWLRGFCHSCEFLVDEKISAKKTSYAGLSARQDLQPRTGEYTVLRTSPIIRPYLPIPINPPSPKTQNIA